MSRSALETVPSEWPPRSTDTDAVCDSFHLAQLVRDEDHRATLRAGHSAQRHEEDIGLLRGEHGGGLVEDQDPRVAIQCLEDLDALLLADGELADSCAGIDGEAIALREQVDALLDLGAAQPKPALVAEHHVLGDGKRLDEPEMLVHHANAGLQRVARRVELDTTPV